VKILDSIRASMLLGKGHKFLEAGRYREALEKALKAKRLQLDEQFEWLCHSIEGKSRFHLGDEENALPALRRAQKILASKSDEERESKHFQNIVGDIDSYIEKIEKEDS
jgi:tetratricopeptide (TPR) repeat protein